MSRSICGTRTARILGWILAGAATIALAAACGSSSSGGSGGSSATSGGGGSSSSGSHLNIAYLDNGPTTYTKAADAELTKAAKAMNVSITFFEPNFDPQTQVQQCQDAISSGKYKGFLIYPVSNATAIPCVTQAAAANIKVVANEGQVGPKFYVDGPPQVKGEDAWDSIDATYWSQQMAKATAQACAHLKANPCRVAFFSGPPSYALVAAELPPFQAALAKYHNIQLVAHDAPGYDAPNAAITATQDLLQKQPNINVIDEDDDSSAAGVATALARANKTGKVLLVGDGANAEAIQRVKNGSEYATAANFPQSDAKWALGVLVRAIRGQSISDNAMPEQNLSPLGKGVILITKANADKFTAQWGS